MVEGPLWASTRRQTGGRAVCVCVYVYYVNERGDLHLGPLQVPGRRLRDPVSRRRCPERGTGGRGRVASPFPEQRGEDVDMQHSGLGAT